MSKRSVGNCGYNINKKPKLDVSIVKSNGTKDAETFGQVEPLRNVMKSSEDYGLI